MGFQAIIQAEDETLVRKCLGDVADASEIFRISSDRIGISVPTKVLDTIGEDQFRSRLSQLRWFDLYAGTWIEPQKSLWRLWS
jgi:hypothetical protein